MPSDSPNIKILRNPLLASLIVVNILLVALLCRTVTRTVFGYDLLYPVYTTCYLSFIFLPAIVSPWISSGNLDYLLSEIVKIATLIAISCYLQCASLLFPTWINYFCVLIVFSVIFLFFIPAYNDVLLENLGYATLEGSMYYNCLHKIRALSDMCRLCYTVSTMEVRRRMY
ncbi:hypothetical protein BDQ12DRAFT_686950 [Crucibulum laeve]|uniref:Uncharacterized protein n=1 Tax=Crucibulum laeve TaxID=68775 RepID=A0A5C3LWJ4_9AGAR|nr:hypothetical protein BDQ12DRAFT_686950 [Crucibulum laeve]